MEAAVVRWWLGVSESAAKVAGSTTRGTPNVGHSYSLYTVTTRCVNLTEGTVRLGIDSEELQSQLTRGRLRAARQQKFAHICSDLLSSCVELHATKADDSVHRGGILWNMMASLVVDHLGGLRRRVRGLRSHLLAQLDVLFGPVEDV